MNSEYIFSAYVQRTTTKTITPKWWEFWKKPTTIEGLAWDRSHIVLNEEEAEWVRSIDLIGVRTPEATAFLKAFAKGGEHNLTNMQLEQLVFSNPYVKTESA